MQKAKQLSFLKTQKTEHGGSLKHPQKRKRPLSTKLTMHLQLKSTQARGPWSFRKHKTEIDKILKKFAGRYHVEIISYANVGNHIHLHIRLFRREFYTPFIRAVTAAVMMKVTGFSQWRPKPDGFQFWDHRPFSRIIQSYQAFKNMVDYIQINYLEGRKIPRKQAEEIVREFSRLKFSPQGP
jgi:hypothetical protein